MPNNDRPVRDRWPILPSTPNKLAFDTPVRDFLAADGWEECRFGHHAKARQARSRDEHLLPLARALFIVVALLALALSARLAAHLFVGSVGAVAPVAVLAEPRLD